MDFLSDPLPASDMRTERVKKSVDRTLAWAKMQIQQMSVAAVAAAPAASTDRGEEDADGPPPAKRAAVAAPSVPHMFAAVQGGGIAAERARCAAALSALPELCGFSLGGFGTGESPTERDTLIRATVAALAPTKPRLISGVGSPEEVLRCVAAGVDLFSTDYPFSLAANGCAMVFEYDPSSGVSGGMRADVNLHDASFAEDDSKLTESSSVEYSRA